MREKIFNVLNKIYGAILIVAFFAGILPLFPFIAALIIGGEIGEAICVFLYNDYYPWVIAASAIAVTVGWVSLYFLKNEKKNLKDKAKNNTNEAHEPKSIDSTGCHTSESENSSKS